MPALECGRYVSELVIASLEELVPQAEGDRSSWLPTGTVEDWIQTDIDSPPLVPTETEYAVIIRMSVIEKRQVGRDSRWGRLVERPAEFRRDQLIVVEDEMRYLHLSCR
jgi:hypothetical protein